MTRLVRFGGIHDEYSLEMYKKIIENNPDVFVEDSKPKKKTKKTGESKKKDSKPKKKSKVKVKVSLKQLQKLAKSKKISIYKKGTKTPLTITGLKTRLTRNKIKYI